MHAALRLGLSALFLTTAFVRCGPKEASAQDANTQKPSEPVAAMRHGNRPRAPKPADTAPPVQPPAAAPTPTPPPTAEPAKPAAAKSPDELPPKFPFSVGTAGEDIAGVVARGTPIYKWADEHGFTEGPACAPDGSMYFTDVAGNQVLQVDAMGAKVALKDSKGMNGLFFAKDGVLYGCQSGEQRIVAIDVSPEAAAKKDRVRVICDKGPGGAPLGKVNDLVLDRSGGIWFSAPVIGRKREGNAPDAVYYVPTAGGEAVQVVRDDKVVAPNGVHLSPDGKTLYVLPYLSLNMMAYPVLGPGKLGPGKVFYSIPSGTRETIGGDGLTVDIKGNVYITVPARSAVFVLSPEGTPLGMIRFPERPSNCALGGTEGKTLFVTAQKSVYAIEVEGSRSR